ncbi:hypothetical protein FQZ97_887250 [compost metagenome]
MDVLVARIRQLTRAPWYRRKKDDRRYQARQQELRVCDYSDAVVDRYSRTVLVRVNLYYYADAQARLRVEHVFDDLDRLIAERDRNPIFACGTGHSRSIEQGEDEGYHIRTVFVLNGAETTDVYKARQTGELWKRIICG